MFNLLYYFHLFFCCCVQISMRRCLTWWISSRHLLSPQRCGKCFQFSTRPSQKTASTISQVGQVHPAPQLTTFDYPKLSCKSLSNNYSYQPLPPLLPSSSSFPSPILDIMCALYNFVKVGTAVFLSNPGNVEAVVSMCKAVMAGDSGEDPQVHACKLLEVVLLECRGSIDNVSELSGLVEKHSMCMSL